jgi:tRNA pseudouridine38-40 synthase
MSRWKCVCAYDGSGFVGWQSQPRGVAVQDVIEARLRQILGKPVRIHGSGRTDAGVHAAGQVFHFDADWTHGPDKLASALVAGLPATIQIVSIRRAAPTFHARFSAVGKTYRYRIHLGDADPFTRPYCWMCHRPLDLAAMAAAAAVLRGRHDFRAFSARSADQASPAAKLGADGADRALGNQDDETSADTVRDLRRLDLVRRSRLLTVTAEADGFLYKMVRSLVGALVAVGEGRLDAARIADLLASGRRTAAVQTAPPQGLCLLRVRYRSRGSTMPARPATAAAPPVADFAAPRRTAPNSVA